MSTRDSTDPVAARRRRRPAASALAASLLVVVVVVVVVVSVADARPLVFTSPLRVLTLPDRPSTALSPRERFLKRFAAGASSESRRRRELAQRERERRDREERDRDTASGDEDQDDDGYDYLDVGGDVGGRGSGPADDADAPSDWAEASEAADLRYREERRRDAERAFDEGFANAVVDETDAGKATPSPKDDNEYQFVGVVPDADADADADARVRWYARKKPASADWSVRLVKADGAAVVREGVVQGRLDLYGRYVNRGAKAETTTPTPSSEDEDDATTTAGRPRTRIVPNVEAEYVVRKRSWRTLWNFSPVSFFAKDRSGSYWRERRLPPGLYTDGDKIYEGTYHYGEGQNGMKPIENFGLDEYMETTGATKEDLTERLSRAPDLVLEY